MNKKAYPLLKRLTRQSNFSFSSLLSCKYPYIFGGIPAKSNSVLISEFCNRVFGKETTEGFKQAYLAVLAALRDKDKPFLDQIMEKNLTRELAFQDVDFVNENDQINVEITNGFVTLGGAFQRTPANSNPVLLKKMGQLQALLCQGGLMAGAGKFSVLFGYQVYFSSKAKLVPKGSTKNIDKTQNHMLQFEISNTLSIMQLMPLMAKFQKQFIKDKNLSSLGQNQMMDTIMILLGKNYQWKIGDMDKVLNRNFTISDKKGPTLPF